MADTTESNTSEQQQQAAVVPKPYVSKHPLQNPWTMWYDNPGKRVSQNNWSEYVKKLNTFHTVEDFWCLFNNIVAPSQLASGSNYHMFKDGVEPKWEDPANLHGGKWVVVVSKSQRAQLDELWLRTLLSLIGENYDDGDDICGCVVSLRKAQDKIAIWTSPASNEDAVKRIGASIRQHLELPADIKITYQVHADSMKQNSSYNNPNKYEL